MRRAIYARAQRIESLDAALRAAPTAQARAHGACLGAEIARLGLGDEAGMRRRLAQAERARPTDVRPRVFRLVEGLASGDQVPPASRVGADLAGAPLGEARQALSRLREGGQAPDSAPRPGSGSSSEQFAPYDLLLAGREALRRHDVGTLVACLRAVEGENELGPGASWLVSVLSAPHRDLRSKAIGSLVRLIEGPHGALARRALAARALELGDPDKAAKVADSADESSLGLGDRLAIAALGAGAPGRLGEHAQAAAQEPGLGPLAAAAVAALTDPGAPGRTVPDVGTQESRGAAALGRELGAQARPEAAALGDEGLAEAAERLLRSDPHSGAALAVRLELAHRAGDVGRVAETLLAGVESVAGAEMDRALCAAVFAELAGDDERLHAELTTALGLDPGSEAALRLGLRGAGAEAAAGRLGRYADAVAEPERAALALVEAALCWQHERTEPERVETLLEQSSERAPELPVGALCGWLAAVGRGALGAERDWLARLRDPDAGQEGRVFELVREALHTSPEDTAQRARLLGAAHQARPADLGLRRLYERASAEAGPTPALLADQAGWLAARAAELDGAEGASLALEAAVAADQEGERERAAELVRQAWDKGDAALAPVLAERYALLGHGAAEHLRRLAAGAGGLPEGPRRAEHDRRLAALEAAAGAAGVVARLRAALASEPGHLPTLYELARRLFPGGPSEELENALLDIAGALSGPEAAGHAQLGARLRQRRTSWDETFAAVELCLRQQPERLWAQRQMLAHATLRQDHELLARLCEDLAPRSDHRLERATLLLRAAEAHLALHHEPAARALLERIVAEAPEHYVAHASLCRLLDRAGPSPAAAQAFERLAQASESPREKSAALYRAATLWLAVAPEQGQAEGRRLLEALVAIDVAYEDAFARLRAIYEAAGAKRELAELCGRRAQALPAGKERTELEVARGKLLAELGATEAARAALQAALAESPENPDALSAYADVCAAREDWPAVEQAVIGLGRLVADRQRQIEIYLRLGALYEEHLPNPERALLAYQEVLKRDPGCVPARDRLSELYLRAGDPARAVEQQEALVAAAQSPADKCRRMVRQAEIYERAGDGKQAEATLVKARRSWPRDPAPVGALFGLYERTGEQAAASRLLDAAAAEAQRGFAAGRFEAPLFEMAVTIAELRRQADAAAVMRATFGAVEGKAAEIEGVGDLAAQKRHDERLAPEVFDQPFRALLAATGALLDAAVPLDLKTILAKPLPAAHAEVARPVRELAAAYGLSGIEIYTSNAMGISCLPASIDPPAVVLGQALVASGDAALREFLTHRALKVLQARSAGLARTAPIDLWPLLAAYLKLHAPGFEPKGADAARMRRFHDLMAKHLPAPLAPELQAAAEHVAETIGNRASSLGTFAYCWGTRAALLAMGSPELALRALAWALGPTPDLPEGGRDRLKWIARQAEARDLVAFAASEAHAGLRREILGG
ncbi:MAG: hypothetical protein HY744_30855 [Deltaproteobacteria bacterium]|nr:hypothetical protein [Deltaproteobacteria bacterium]